MVCWSLVEFGLSGWSLDDGGLIGSFLSGICSTGDDATSNVFSSQSLTITNLASVHLSGYGLSGTPLVDEVLIGDVQHK